MDNRQDTRKNNSQDNRRRRCLHLTPTRALLVLGFASVLPAGVTANSPPELAPTEVSNSFQIPTGETRPIHPLSPNAPAAVKAFLERGGPGNRVHYDPESGTPTFVYAHNSREIVPPDMSGPQADPEQIGTGALAFLEENADFFGVSSNQLTRARVVRVGTSWRVVFRQTSPGGTPLRGANVSLVVGGNGELVFAKCFLLRDCPEPEGPFQSRETALASLADWEITVLEARQEIIFTSDEPSSATMAWTVHAEDVNGQELILFLDAKDASLLGYHYRLKSFDGDGAVNQIAAEGFVDALSLREDGAVQREAVEGAVIRDREGEVLGVSGRQGQVAVPVRDVRADLMASLEYGVCVPSGSDCFGPSPQDGSHFQTLVSIRPQRDVLGAHEDFNDDGIPDAQITQHPVGLPFRLTFHQDAYDPNTNEPQSLLERTWWTTAHKTGYGLMQFFENVLRAAGLDQPPFWPPQPLNLELWLPSTLIPDDPFYSAGRDWGTVYAVRFVPEVDAWGVPVRDANDNYILEATAPSLLLHEMGHHIIHTMTGTTDERFPDFEEGIADALAGMVSGDCRIGYGENYQETSRSFCLGFDSDEIRSQIRRDVGNGFWDLHKKLRNPESLAGADVAPREPTVGAQILFHWLGFHRGEEEDMRLFGRENNLLEQLLLVDDLPFFGGDNDLSNGTPHATVISDTFRGKRYFERPFIRGNANFDSIVDISDAVILLSALFLSDNRALDCRNAMDTNNDSVFDLSDPVFLLNYLFLGGPVVPPPYGVCGFDLEPPWDPGNLGCYDSPCPW